jgi:hypothetical protein
VAERNPSSLAEAVLPLFGVACPAPRGEALPHHAVKRRKRPILHALQLAMFSPAQRCTLANFEISA